MSGLHVIGVACSGDPDHRRRHWCVDSERRLKWRDVSPSVIPDAVGHALRLSIPGSAGIVVCDPFKLVAVLADMSSWRLDWRGTPMWRPMMAEDDVSKSREPVLVAGGSTCGGMWLVGRDRRVSVWTAQGLAPLSHAPVPGASRIVAVDAPGRTVLVDDGARFAWLEGQWCPLSSVLDDKAARGTMRVQVLSDVCIGDPHGDVTEGQILELPEAEARHYISTRRMKAVALNVESGA